jgi:hypothetical protein
MPLVFTYLPGLNLTGAAQDAALDGFIRGSLTDASRDTEDVLAPMRALSPVNIPQLSFSSADSLFDRSSAWYGKNVFMTPRCRFTAHSAARQPVYVYHFREQTTT